MALNKIADNNVANPLTLGTLRVDGTFTSSGTAIFTGGSQSTVGIIARQSQVTTGTDLQQWQQGDGFVWGRVTSQGEFQFGANGSTVRLGTNSGGAAALVVTSTSTAQISAIIKGSAGIATDIFQVQNSAGTVFTQVLSNGILVNTRPILANDSATDTTGFQTKRTSIFLGTVTTEPLQIIRGATNQTADLIQTQDGGSNPLTRIDALGKILIPGGSTLYDYAVETPGSTDTAWKKLIEVTCAVGLFTGASYELEVVDSFDNYGIADRVAQRFNFYVKITRSGGVQDDGVIASVVGPSVNYVRVVKTSSSLYEIQVRQPDVFRIVSFKARRVGTNNTSESYTPSGKTYAGLAAGATVGTIYVPVNDSVTVANFMIDNFSQVSSNRITIQPLGTLASGTPLLTLTGSATQNSNYIEVRNNGGTVLGGVTPAGRLYVQRQEGIQFMDGLSTLRSRIYSGGNNGMYFDTGGGAVRILTLDGGSETIAGTSLAPYATNRSGLIIRGLNGQSADLEQWQTFDGTTATTVSQVSAAGFISTTRNFSVNQSNAGEIMIIAKGAVSQTGDAIVVRDTSSNGLGGFSATGRLFAGTSASGNTGLSTLLLGSVNTVAQQLGVIARETTTVGVVVRGAASQTADLTQWQDSAGATLASVLSNGVIKGAEVRTNGTQAVLREVASGGNLYMVRATSTPGNPGANVGTLFYRDGTTAGTLKLATRTGASGVEETIVDNLSSTGSTAGAQFVGAGGVNTAGTLTSAGLILTGANSPINLPTGGNGTSGQVIVSTGTGTTPVWGVPTYPSTAQQLFLASPTSGSGTPTFRYISTSDFTQYASPTTGQALVAAPVTGGWAWSSVITSNGGSLTGTLGITGTLAQTGTASPITLNGSAGTSGQVLTSAGAGATPTWTNPNLVAINATAKTAAYTLATGDYGTMVQMNGAFAFTVGTGLYNTPVGTQITLLALTSGVTVAASGAGVVVNSTPGLKLRAQYSTATLICLSSGASACTWLLTGDLSA